MKHCNECNKIMQQEEGTTPEGIKYDYYKCINCGEEIIDRLQLHEVAEKYR